MPPVSSPEEALIERIKELRRRHFGPRGKGAFAERLGVPLDMYERFERGAVPPGEILVRMCELTGEDLQWLLVGVPARGTVLISGARARHQELLARLARLLDERPALAAPVEAFIDLLIRGEQARAAEVRQLPHLPPQDWIPIFEPDELPLSLEDNAAVAAGGGFPLLPVGSLIDDGRRESACLAEPAGEYPAASLRSIEVISQSGASGRARQYVQCCEVATCFARMFGVRLDDDAMSPMFQRGDAVLAAVGAGPRVGRPALCRLSQEPVVRCRVWLGLHDEALNLGRFSDGEIERVEPAEVRWALEALYRLSWAA